MASFRFAIRFLILAKESRILVQILATKDGPLVVGGGASEGASANSRGARASRKATSRSDAAAAAAAAAVATVCFARGPTYCRIRDSLSLVRSTAISAVTQPMDTCNACFRFRARTITLVQRTKGPHGEALRKFNIKVPSNLETEGALVKEFISPTNASFISVILGKLSPT